MGVPYGAGHRMDLADFGRTVRPLAAPGRTLIVEPGRALVAEAGVLLTTVQYLKRSGRRTFAILDAGMTDLIRPALYQARHPVVPVRRRKGKAKTVEAVGPICETADSFGRWRLPDPRSGDLWAILVAGAYGFSMTSQYNGRPRPPELLATGGRLTVARPRETYRDLL